MRSVVIMPEADRDIDDAWHWYERQRPGLGIEFLSSLNAAIRAIRSLPEAHEVVARRTRKMLLHRFPYVLLYTVDLERVLILALFDGRRDPRRWSGRVRELPASFCATTL